MRCGAKARQAEGSCRCQFRSIASMYRSLNDDPDGELSEVCGSSRDAAVSGGEAAVSGGEAAAEMQQ